MGNINQHAFTPQNQLSGSIGFEDLQNAIVLIERYNYQMNLPVCSKWNTHSFSQFSQTIKRNPPCNIILNTLPNHPKDQRCIIPQTIQPSFEEEFINWLIQNKLYSRVSIFIYGRNSCDSTTEAKQNELKKLGFKVFIYRGGLFEWLLLQDIYGDGNHIERHNAEPYEIEFPTTNNELDILKYKPQTLFPKMIDNR